MKNQFSNNDWKTPLGYYEKAIADLRKTQEQLIEELKNVNSFKADHYLLKEELKQAHQEIDILKNKLEVAENTIAAIQETANSHQSKLMGNEKAMNYLYEQLELTKGKLQEVTDNVNLSQKRINDIEETANLSRDKVYQFSDQFMVISKITGTDYITLRNLLNDKKWKQADEETRKILLKISARKKTESLNDEQIINLPCEDLQIINRLWFESSDGHFGFNVQKRIWYECGKHWERWGDRIGWRRNGSWLLDYDKLIFSLNAPSGHLPVIKGKVMGTVFSRISSCGM
ncbi:MAG: GUN4 domain-containing protein [Halothece sp.]